MNKLAIIPVFFLTMCGTAPVTPPAAAFELVVEESHWDKVYHAIEYIKRGQREKNMTQPEDTINRALMEFENGSNDTTKQKELLQLSSDGDKSSS
tara:strand:+ start:406 stop:690 length:285 start_codon:yes stop_codon:yes gene_type:complete